jgi:endonuclease/exonuclease/phosphatase family metal-dependent hydrolase
MPRIVTYNIHRCVGVDRKLDVGRVAATIAALEPDIVALQEVDVGRARSGGVDQAHEIAGRLKMSSHFNAALRVEEEQYGDAILTTYPERLVKAGALPGLNPRLRLEPRGALWVELEIHGVKIQIINTHLGLVAREQQRQATALASHEWLRHDHCKAPVILVGDFNATMASVVYRTLTARLKDARRLTPNQQPTGTFPSRFPFLRLDHVFVSDAVKVVHLDAPYDAATRIASDHLPLVMDFEVGA